MLPPRSSCLSLRRASLFQPCSSGGSARRAGCLRWSLPLRGWRRACLRRTPGLGWWDQDSGGWGRQGGPALPCGHSAVVSSAEEPAESQNRRPGRALLARWSCRSEHRAGHRLQPREPAGSWGTAWGFPRHAMSQPRSLSAPYACTPLMPLDVLLR